SPVPAPAPPAVSAPAVLPAAARSRPREIDLIRRLLWTAMVFCMVGDAVAVYRLITDPDPMMMGAAALLSYLAMQAMMSPGPLGRGARWAWTWTTASAALGLTGGVSVFAMGIMWFSSQPLLLLVGAVWTGLYFAAISLLVTQRVRDWIFA
ncbi:hypothetical protein, partial [Glycomyces tenuis]